MTTPRDVDAIKIEKWADTGDRIDPEDVALMPALDRSVGWGPSFSQLEGDTPRRQVFNQLLAEITAALGEINAYGGLLPWDSRVRYNARAHILGQDGRIYRAKQESLNVDPVTDTDRSHWEPLINTVGGTIAPSGIAGATEELAGVSEWATQTEMNNGDATRVARPNVILGWFQSAARFAANQITGVLSEAQIPGLPASRITSGQFGEARISGLPASKTTSGTFDQARIPNLDASKTTTGTFADARIPSLGFDKIPIQIHTTQSSYNSAPNNDGVLHILVG